MRPRTTLLIVLCTLLAGVAPAGAVGAADGAATAPAIEGATGAEAALQQADCTYPVSATDATGTEVTVEEAPETVTTLGPSAAQTMWEIGGKEQVVGLGTNAEYLADAESRTNVSAAGYGYSTEAIVGTEADIVLAANIVPNATVSSLRDAGMTVFKFGAATSVADVADKTTLIGRLTGNCEGAAEANAWMNANVETAGAVTADAEDVRALVPLGGGFVVGNGTFIHSMLTAAGGENVAAAEYGAGYTEASDEVVVQLDPEVLVLQPWMAGFVNQEPYASTTAGQNNASVTVEANYLNQPAPRSVVYATRNLTEGLHPDAAASAEWTARSEVSVATPTATATATESAMDTDTPTATEAMTESTEEPTTTDGPGFGAGVAVAALAAGAALLGRRD